MARQPRDFVPSNNPEYPIKQGIVDTLTGQGKAFQANFSGWDSDTDYQVLMRGTVDGGGLALRINKSDGVQMLQANDTEVTIRTLTVSHGMSIAGGLTVDNLVVTALHRVGVLTTNELFSASVADGVVVVGSWTPATATNDKFQVIGGRSYFQPANEDQAVAVSYNTTTGVYWLGGTNSATPDLVVKNTSAIQRLRLTDAGFIGQSVGFTDTIAPLFQYHSKRYNSWNQMVLDSVGSANYGAQLFFRSGRGDYTTITASQSGDILAYIAGAGHTGTGTTFGSGAVIQAVATGNFSSSSYPTKLLFQTVPSGSTTLATRLVIDQNGDAQFAEDVQIDKTLHVVQATTMDAQLSVTAGGASITGDVLVTGALDVTSVLTVDGNCFLGNADTDQIGFYGGSGAGRQTITGNIMTGTLADLQSVVNQIASALGGMNLVLDSTT